MEKKLETTIAYKGYIGIMNYKMEPTIVYRALQCGHCNILQPSCGDLPKSTYGSNVNNRKGKSKVDRIGNYRCSSCKTLIIARNTTIRQRRTPRGSKDSWRLYSEFMP